MIYLDTSALVKRYVQEKGSSHIDALFSRSDFVAASMLAYPEILSAFQRRYRDGDYSKETLAKIMRSFESEWKSLFIIKLTEDIVLKTKELILAHFLRGADSIHLSSALWLKSATKADVTFVASDAHLISAARAEKRPSEKRPSQQISVLAGTRTA